MTVKPWFLLAAAMLSMPVAAQHATPYAGQQHRQIKALSDSEIDDLISGRGMGLARAAELNGYPGPKHVLELAEEMALTAEQKGRTQAIFQGMHDEAVRLGKQIVDRERELDRAFAEGTIDADALESMLREIGLLEANLRRVHLAAHLEQREILTDQQLAAYKELRGYGRGRGHPGTEHAGH